MKVYTFSPCTWSLKSPVSSVIRYFGPKVLMSTFLGLLYGQSMYHLVIWVHGLSGSPTAPRQDLFTLLTVLVHIAELRRLQLCGS